MTMMGVTYVVHIALTVTIRADLVVITWLLVTPLANGDLVTGNTKITWWIAIIPFVNANTSKIVNIILILKNIRMFF